MAPVTANCYVPFELPLVIEKLLNIVLVLSRFRIDTPENQELARTRKPINDLMGRVGLEPTTKGL